MTIEKVKITSIEEWQDWVTSPPPEEQIETIDGIFIIRHNIIEKKLDMITNFNWETRNYQSKIIELVDANNVKHQYISASLELVLTTLFFRNIRVLVGAVSVPMAFFTNEDGTLQGHFDNTAKSLCIRNAASELGEQFGRNLNDIAPVISQRKKSNNRRQPVKMKPDMKILKQYAEAVAFNDIPTVEKLLALYEFPEPINPGYAE